MTKLDLFHGKNQTRNMNVKLDMNGKGCSADLSIQYQNIQAKAELKAMELDEFKKTPLYIDNQHNIKSETLFKTWNIIQTSNTIARFSSEHEPVIIFTSDHHPENDLNILISNFSIAYISIAYIDCFAEIKFAMYLNDELQLSFDEFRKLMGEDRIQLIEKNKKEFEELISCKLTPTFLCMLDIKKFEVFLKHSKDLNDALKVTTIHQIVGLGHQPPFITAQTSNENNSMEYYFSGSFSIQGFDYNSVRTQRGNEIILTANKKAKLEIKTINQPDEQSINQLNEKSKCSTTKNITMINHWHLLLEENKPEEKKEKRMLFCSSNSNVVIEEADHDFPMCEIEKRKQLMTLLSPYHNEKYFTDLLKERGYAIEKLYQTEGITREKLNILLTHTDATMELIDRGFQLTRLGKVDIQRLNFIMKNFDEAKKALIFVDANVLFGLNAAKQSLVWSEPQRPKINEPEKSFGCTIV